MSQQERSEQEIVRREKLARVREKGYPFPNDVKVTALATEIREKAAAGESLESESTDRDPAHGQGFVCAPPGPLR